MANFNQIQLKKLTNLKLISLFEINTLTQSSKVPKNFIENTSAIKNTKNQNHNPEFMTQGEVQAAERGVKCKSYFSNICSVGSRNCATDYPKLRLVLTLMSRHRLRLWPVCGASLVNVTTEDSKFSCAITVLSRTNTGEISRALQLAPYDYSYKLKLLEQLSLLQFIFKSFPQIRIHGLYELNGISDILKQFFNNH